MPVLGALLFGRAAAQGFRGLGEHPLQLCDRGADGRTQRGQSFVRCCRLTGGFLRTNGEFGGPLPCPHRLFTFVVGLPGRLAPLAECGPESGQDDVEFGEGLPYRGQRRPVRGQPQIGCRLLEVGGGRLGPLGRSRHLGGPLVTAGPGPAHGVRSGCCGSVCPDQGSIVGHVGQLGVERAATGRQGMRLRVSVGRLAPEEGEFFPQGYDPAPPRGFPGALSDVLGGAFGPTAGEDADAVASVHRDPGAVRGL